ncbi:MAG: aldo/keto reductase [Anaerolineales bacterium]|nr:aldo/keto reductase [Anaerolineales bacterium]
MGLGAWQWGDRIMWQYGHTYFDEDLKALFDICIEEGITLIDTAEVYGLGKSERLLGRFIAETQPPVLVATKYFPFPWRMTKKALHRALRHSLERLNLEAIDLYQIHFPSPVMSIDRLMEALVEAAAAGQVRTVGISNFNESQTLAAYSALARNNVPLASNQLRFSLLDRTIEKNGLLARCHELGIRVIAYSPLAQGILTGKYTPENLPPGNRGLLYAEKITKCQPLIKLMTQIGQDQGGKSASQVALNWCICKGTLPIPGAKQVEQARQNAGALGWRLTDEQVEALDEASDQVN